MIFDPFKNGPSAATGRDQKKRAFLVGNGEGRVHLLVKMALYRARIFPRTSRGFRTKL